MSFQAGLKALKQGSYAEAVDLLEQASQNASSQQEMLQAQMWLVKAYHRNGQLQEAIALCQSYLNHENDRVRDWAETSFSTLEKDREIQVTQRLEAGKEALGQKRYNEAVEALETACQLGKDNSATLQQAQMQLVKAYRGNGQPESAIALCQQLSASADPLMKDWAAQTLAVLNAQQAKRTTATSETKVSQPEPQATASPLRKAGRVAQTGVKLAMKGVAGNLALASSVTVSILFGMVLALCVGLLLIVGGENPLAGLVFSVVITLIFNLAVFFISPWIMDLVQRWLYGTRWVSLDEVRRGSREAAETIERVCRQKNLKQPRLGIIEDQNPTAFTYGSLPNSARLVVSRGLFTYLDEDEVATVYAHELGHIVHWDFAVMTLAATLVQITYLIYLSARRLGRGGGNNKLKDAAESAAIAAYIFYILGTYLQLYLSRVREYYADHFAAEVTGNPNGLSRALVKIAYGILEESQRSEEPSRLMEGTRALGIYDPKAASSTGTAYRIASEPEKLGRVFLWDLFNPWGWWMELQSTHPLTGKRVRALSTYAEQLDLDTEFDFANVVREGKRLDKKKLYGNFALDLVVFRGNIIGLILGLILGGIALGATQNFAILPSLMLMGFGVGTLLKMSFMFPNSKRARETDILSLMGDPYASPLRGQFVKLEGELIGRGDAGNRFGSDLKVQDKTGMIFTRYASRLGAIGNFLFGLRQVNSLIGSQVSATGWFRRGVAPWLDLKTLKSPQKTVESHHRFWMMILGGGALLLGFLLPLLVA